MSEKILYTAGAHVVGGRTEGHGKTTDGALEVDLRLPPELGGQGGGTNPEQLFAVGFASCFESAVGAVARRMKLDPQDVAIDSRVSLHPTPERGFKLSVGLDVTLSGLDGDQAKQVVAAAHTVCPYSNATRGNIDVDITVNGEPVT
jgi:Ohr subfamily peroxiredoxin